VLNDNNILSCVVSVRVLSEGLKAESQAITSKTLKIAARAFGLSPPSREQR